MTIWEPGFFWLLCWFFESTPPAVSFSAPCHTLTSGSLWPKSWWVPSLFSGHSGQQKNRNACAWYACDTHTCACACLKTQANTCLLDHAVPLHNTSRGWLLFCSASKNVLSPFPPLLFLPVFFHYGGRNCGWDSRPSLPTACPDY